MINLKKLALATLASGALVLGMSTPAFADVQVQQSFPDSDKHLGWAWYTMDNGHNHLVRVDIDANVPPLPLQNVDDAYLTQLFYNTNGNRNVAYDLIGNSRPRCNFGSEACIGIWSGIRPFYGQSWITTTMCWDVYLRPDPCVTRVSQLAG